MPIYNSSYTGIQIDAAVAKYFVLENDGGAASKNWVNSMLEGYQPLGSYVTTTSLNSTLADYSTSSVIASNYLSKTDAANTYQPKGSYAAASHSHSYLPLSGGTLTGSLTFANNTWNVVGDDCAIGDVNSAGALGIKGQNGTTNLRFIQYNGTAAGTLSWSGSSFNFSAPIYNSSSTDAVIVHNPISLSYIAGTKGIGACAYAKKTLNASQWYPVIVTDTYAGGGWAIGTYTSEALQFVYGTKANRDSNTNSCSILNLNPANGTISVSTSSSYKIKENIQDFKESEAKKLLQLRCISFDYKKEYGEKNQYGFIVEEVEPLIPQVVYKPNIDIQQDSQYWSIEYQKFVPHIIKLLQIQQQEINDLKEQIAQSR